MLFLVLLIEKKTVLLFTVVLSFLLFCHCYLDLNFKLSPLLHKRQVGFSVEDWLLVIDIGHSDLQHCVAGLPFCVYGLQSR